MRPRPAQIATYALFRVPGARSLLLRERVRAGGGDQLLRHPIVNVGLVVEAEIVERRFVQDRKAEAPPAHYGTLRWGYGSGYHTSELKIPEKWYDLPEGESVPIRIHPDRPDNAIIEHWWSNPAFKMLGVVFGIVVVAFWVWLLLGSGNNL